MLSEPWFQLVGKELAEHLHVLLTLFVCRGGKLHLQQLLFLFRLWPIVWCLSPTALLFHRNKVLREIAKKSRPGRTRLSCCTQTLQGARMVSVRTSCQSQWSKPLQLHCSHWAEASCFVLLTKELSGCCSIPSNDWHYGSVQEHQSSTLWCIERGQSVLIIKMEW